jgi:glucan 1,3-beta-glucosidase
MTCKATRSRRFEPPFHGVSLGGFLVIEPWITPSLFYQFLGTPERFGADAPQHTAVDLYTFCSVLGAEEANRQLRRHWAAWVTEDDIRRLSEMKVNALRIPVGDWMWAPYGPYAGCTEGALAELDRALDLAHKYGMRVLLDLHGVRGSQNGFDNSGRTSELQWTQVPGMPPAGAVQSSFSHWPLQAPGWIGQFDRAAWRTVSINYTQLDLTIGTLAAIADMYGGHPAVFGLQPLNEPWQHTPIGPLKRFYWEGYKVVARRAPHWKYVLSDSFRPEVKIWAPFMTGW